uniref:Uncharacterized protein n=1 Tax=Ditylenchus dipsaci TaxID=166011 RepID=A0A915DFZ0_9BILA
MLHVSSSSNFSVFRWTIFVVIDVPTTVDYRFDYVVVTMSMSRLGPAFRSRIIEIRGNYSNSGLCNNRLLPICSGGNDSARINFGLISYTFKAVISTILMITGIALYSDVAFPCVMYCLGKIFGRIDLY